MMKKLAPIGLLALAVGAAAPAQAGPAAGSLTAAIAPNTQTSNVTEVRWRGHHRGGHRFGRGVAIGLGAAILGGVVANEFYRPRAGYYYDDYAYDGPYYAPSSYRGDARVLCAENFRSFEWRTGLYTTYSGHKRLCPYLR